MTWKKKKSFVNLALKRDEAFPVHDLIAPLYATSTWRTTNKEPSVPPKDFIAKQYNAWRFLKRRNSLWKQRIIAWQILFDDKSYHTTSFNSINQWCAGRNTLLILPCNVCVWFRSVVVITSALHAEGRQFDPGRNQMRLSLFFFNYFRFKDQYRDHRVWIP